MVERMAHLRLRVQLTAVLVICNLLVRSLSHVRVPPVRPMGIAKIKRSKPPGVESPIMMSIMHERFVVSGQENQLKLEDLHDWDNT